MPTPRIVFHDDAILKKEFADRRLGRTVDEDSAGLFGRREGQDGARK
jgi:hypothetical protein